MLTGILYVLTVVTRIIHCCYSVKPELWKKKVQFSTYVKPAKAGIQEECGVDNGLGFN